MRRLICLLLIVSLSWVTTGYACRMDGLNVVRAVCCCPHGQHKAPKAAEPVPEASIDAKDHSSCCEVVSNAALDDQQPGLVAEATLIDLPVGALLPSTRWDPTDPATLTVVSHPPVRGPPLGSGTRTYLTTARLRL